MSTRLSPRPAASGPPGVATSGSTIGAPGFHSLCPRPHWGSCPRVPGTWVFQSIALQPGAGARGPSRGRTHRRQVRGGAGGPSHGRCRPNAGHQRAFRISSRRHDVVASRVYLCDPHVVPASCPILSSIRSTSPTPATAACGSPVLSHR